MRRSMFLIITIIIIIIIIIIVIIIITSFFPCERIRMASNDRSYNEKSSEKITNYLRLPSKSPCFKTNISCKVTLIFNHIRHVIRIGFVDQL